MRGTRIHCTQMCVHKGNTPLASYTDAAKKVSYIATTFVWHMVVAIVLVSVKVLKFMWLMVIIIMSMTSYTVMM